MIRAELRRGLPDRLRQTPPVKRPFDHARDPLIRAQDHGKTETQRREEVSGRGSMMVKLHKPFPELRPKHELRPLRAAFNQAWLREQREAVFAQLETQRQQRGWDRGCNIELVRTVDHER